MSSAALSTPAAIATEYVQDLALPNVTTKEAARTCVERRRPNREQGHALEILGHAVEYLIDSRLYMTPDWDAGHQAAVQILMSRSRAVFEECAASPERLPVSFRVGRKVGGWLCRKSFQRGYKG